MQAALSKTVDGYSDQWAIGIYRFCKDAVSGLPVAVFSVKRTE